MIIGAAPEGSSWPNAMLDIVHALRFAAGSKHKEDFPGEAACTFHPKTNLQLQPRSRPVSCHM